MEGVPPSTADFTPAWLKFNNTKKLTQVSAETSPSSLLIQCDTSSNKKYPISVNSSGCRSSGFSKSLGRNNFIHCNQSWPVHIGPKVTNEKQQCCKPSKYSHKWSISATPVARCIPETTATTNVLDAEFPSLESDTSRSHMRNSVTNQANNVWSKPLHIKSVGNNHSHSASSIKTSAVKRVQKTSSIYKNLVPKSNIGFVKQPYRRPASSPIGVPNIDAKTGNNKMIINLSTTSLSNKERQSTKLSLPVVDDNPVTPAIKRHRKGKNIFLKELRQEHDSTTDEATDSEGMFNGGIGLEGEGNDIDGKKSLDGRNADDFEIDSVKRNVEETSWWDDDDSESPGTSPHGGGSVGLNAPLSSSLEAEHRLLREMGWTGRDDAADGDEAGDDESPLTDAEIREFFMRNKKDLVGASSTSRRESALRNALTAWSRSGPPVLRRTVPQEQV